VFARTAKRDIKLCASQRRRAVSVVRGIDCYQTDRRALCSQPMAATPSSGRAIRLSSQTLLPSRALAAARPGDDVITAIGTSHRVVAVVVAGLERVVIMVDRSGIRTQLTVRAATAAKVDRKRQRLKRRRRKGAQAQNTKPPKFKTRSAPDPPSKSVRAVSGGLPSLGKRR
jgi:hypothetical protein